MAIDHIVDEHFRQLESRSYGNVSEDPIRRDANPPECVLADDNAVVPVSPQYPVDFVEVLAHFVEVLVDDVGAFLVFGHKLVEDSTEPGYLRAGLPRPVLG